VENKHASCVLGKMYEVCFTYREVLHIMGKEVPPQDVRVSGGWGSRSPDNQHRKVVRLSSLHTGHLNPPPGNFPGIISVKGLVDFRAICSRKD